MKRFQYSISNGLKSDYIYVNTLVYTTIDDLKRLIAKTNNIPNDKIAYEKQPNKNFLRYYADYDRFCFKILDVTQLYSKKNSTKPPKPKYGYEDSMYSKRTSYYDDEIQTTKKPKISDRSQSFAKSAKNISSKIDMQDEPIVISFFFEKTNKKQYYSFQSKITPDTKISTIKRDIAKKYKIKDEIILKYQSKNTKIAIDSDLSVDDIKDLITENYSNGKRFNIIYVEIREKKNDINERDIISSAYMNTRQHIESRDDTKNTHESPQKKKSQIDKRQKQKSASIYDDDDDDDDYSYLNYKGVAGGYGRMAPKPPAFGGSMIRKVREKSVEPTPRKDESDDEIVRRKTKKPIRATRYDDTTDKYDIGFTGMTKKTVRNGYDDRSKINATVESPEKVKKTKPKRRSASAFKPKIIQIEQDPIDSPLRRRRSKSPRIQAYSPNASQRPHKKPQQQRNSPNISPSIDRPQKRPIDSPPEKPPVLSRKQYNPHKRPIQTNDDDIDNSPSIHRTRKKEVPSHSSSSSVRPHRKAPPVADKAKNTKPKSDKLTYRYQINGDSEIKTIDLDRSATVMTMRQLIADENDVGVENVKVIYAGKELLNDISLEALELEDAILFVYIRYVQEVLLLTAKALRL